MSRLFRQGILVISVLALACMLACTGNDGPQGPPGQSGDQGDPGGNLSAVPPDVYFSLAIFDQFDGTVNYRARDFVKITFDSTRIAGPELVVGRYIAVPPKIDGQDGDIDEWGTGDEIIQSQISLDSIVGTDNGINRAAFRCLYDQDFIYLFISWSEPTNPVPTEDRSFGEWRFSGYPDNVFEQSGAEERLWIMFPIEHGYVPTQADRLLGRGLNNVALGSSLRFDVWDWRAALTDPVGFTDDGYLIYTSDHPDCSVVADAGGGTFLRNINGTVPAWQHLNDPGSNQGYPFWFRAAVPFDADLNWIKNNTIPGYMALVPYGDRANIMAASGFETPKWVVEIKRPRHTGSGNDVQF